MVRHHVKKKKNDTKSKSHKKKQEEKKQLEDELQNLERFAGSSDEEEGSNGEDNDEPSGEEEVPIRDREGEQKRYGDGNSGSESGGSDSDEVDDDDDVYQEETKAPKAHKKDNNNKEESESENSGDEDSEDDYADATKSSDNDDEIISSDPSFKIEKGVGMANAMARILGGVSTIKASEAASKKGTKNVILSKTTTPLQRLQQKMKTEEQALRQKRLNRRAENLSAMRLPLAPSAGMSAEKLRSENKKSKRKRDMKDDNDAAAIANEIEGERTHRRIATRGVVALFNAISKHRAAVAADATAKEEEKRQAREEGRSIRKKGNENALSSETKHGFLDLIKKSASSGDGMVNGTTTKSKDPRVSSPKNGENSSKKDNSVGWSALKDDYMMHSKLKDWDKISDEEDSLPK
jgi:hypothetical protein